MKRGLAARTAPRALAHPEALVVLIGATVLVGWLLDVSALKSVLPSLVTMKANTALAFILAGVSLWLLRARPDSRRSRQAAQAFATVVALIGLLTLSEYLFGWSLRIDELLFREARSAVGTSSPGRMGANTALNFVLAGLSLLLLDVEGRRGFRPAQAGAIVTGSIALFTFAGYLYGAPAAESVFSSTTRMALHTSVAFIVFAVAVLLAHPRSGVMALLTSPGAGGVMTRRLLLPAIALPLLLGWLRLAGERAHLYETEIGLALLVVAVALISVALIWVTARSLERADAERRQRTAQLKAANAELELQTAELREAQRALEESNSLLLAVTDGTTDAVFVKDRDGQYLMINAAGARFLGRSAEEILGKTDAELFSPETGRAIMAGDQEVMAAGTTQTYEDVGEAAGMMRTYLSVKGPYRDAAGNVIGLIGISRDITERKQAEEEIKGLNEDLEQRALELESQNAELEMQAAELEDQQTQLASANDELEAQQAELERALAELAEEKERIDAFYRFAERLASETGAEQLAQTILTELADFAEAEIGTLYALDEETLSLAATRGINPGRLAAELRPGEGLAGRALGERRSVALSHGETGLHLAAFGEEVAVRTELHVPLRQGQRELGVVTLARVAERPFSPGEVEAIEHLAEQAAVALSNALALRQAMRQAGIDSAVLDATADAIFLFGPDGNTLLTNLAAERLAEDLLGAPARETLRRPFHELAAQFADQTTDPEAYRASLEQLADPEYEGTVEWQLADSVRAYQRYTVPVRDASGVLIGRLFVLRDITTEQEAERLKSELVATVSHELRTPLTGILGFAELLVRHDVDEAKRERYVATIYKEARRLTDLINDFLDLQRIESGLFTLALEPVELGELLRQEIELYSRQSAVHDLELALSAEPLVVLGERRRLGQVIGNLLSNAIKYSPKGGPVTVAGEANGGAVRVSVSDSGLGIPADQQRHLFTKFFRVDSSDTREIGGTGLGLALCREIVEANGGRIGFESIEGQGSTFWFELPSAQRGTAAAGRARS